jgi:hypothetical protein
MRELPNRSPKKLLKSEFHANEHEGLFRGSMVRMVVQSTIMLA